MKRPLLFVSLVLICFHSTYSQTQSTDWIWPKDRKTAGKYFDLYTDFFNRGMYRKAIPAFSWLLVNAPRLNSSLYMNGAKIYDNLAENDSDPALKASDADSCLLMFDLLIKYFDDEAGSLNRKAFYAYKFKHDKIDCYQMLFELFNHTFQLNKNNFLDNNLVPYMDVIRRYKLAGGEVSDLQVIQSYQEILDVIEYKKNRFDKNIETLNQYEQLVNNLFSSTITIDCKIIEDILLPGLLADPDNLKMAKNIFKLAFSAKCTESPAFFTSAQTIQNYEPTYGMARLIGDHCAAMNDFPCALKYYSEGLPLTGENSKKVGLYLKEGEIYHLLNDKPTAGKMAGLCLVSDSTMIECYTLLGDLYSESFNDCKQGSNPAQDKAVYIAAYEMYNKAGNQDKMAFARAQFPTGKDLRSGHMKLNQPVQIGCWINKVVTIQKQD